MAGYLALLSLLHSSPASAGLTPTEHQRSGFVGNTHAWIAQGLHTIATLVAFLCVVKGFQYVEPSVGGMIGLTEIIFGIGFGVLFFGEVLTASLSWGAGCILLAALLLAFPDLKKSFM